MLPEKIKTAIEVALLEVEKDVEANVNENQNYGALNRIRAELVEMRDEKRTQVSPQLSYIIIDSLEWDQPSLIELNKVRELLRSHFHLKP